ncbi:hypothetical protein ACIRP5_03675 [Streptomyces sp. NPDC101221]|uniref:hypothetical protein n=1 Tax=Streptomyces sp. NPDC101221 TaxID=3366132 RepID=UPI003803EC89
MSKSNENNPRRFSLRHGQMSAHSPTFLHAFTATQSIEAYNHSSQRKKFIARMQRVWKLLNLDMYEIQPQSIRSAPAEAAPLASR